jgi:septal ring factor EnvC (AmiA/AmiB activator)
VENIRPREPDGLGARFFAAAIISMKTAKHIFITLGFIFLLLCSSSSFAQRPSQKQQLEEMEKESPKLYEFEKRLMDIQKEKKQVEGNYQNKEIEKEEFDKTLERLAKEELAIRDNPDYIAAQQVFYILRMHKPAQSERNGGN